ncbi:MAG: NADH-quinone oxidoreductase subunit M [Bacteroidia bacterium]|nr:NADH-quinone oxidoreductase subunit M [Bacteroidia bacterium]
MTIDAVGTLLCWLLFLPLVGIPFIWLLPARQAKYVALAIGVGVFGFSLFIFQQYLSLADGPRPDGYVVKAIWRWFGAAAADGTWLSRYDVKLILGVDGISIYLILLTTLLFPLSTWFSFSSVNTHEKGYYILLLLLQTGVLGTFLSLDLLLFYVFFELGLIPMYFLIGIWGGKDKIYAAIKFFLYTLAGSVLMLISILYLGSYVGGKVGTGFTTDLKVILDYLAANPLADSTQRWLFWGFTFSFLIKVPVFPLHTWLPAAHVQAPTAGSVILAGLLLKLGTYGLVRFSLPLFPQTAYAYAWVLALLGLIGVIYGALAAMVQTDIKKLVAYSSVAHMGFVIMGIFAFTPQGMSGAVLQMVNHGISTGALFLIVGMVYDRRHTREIADYQGIAKVMPLFTFFFMLATLSSIGLPGMNGFVGEFLILIGSFGTEAFPRWFTVVATTGVILAAVYMLWMFRRVLFGALDKDENRSLTDLTRTEVAILMPLVVLMFWIGISATPWLDQIGSSSDAVVQWVNEAYRAAQAPVVAR